MQHETQTRIARANSDLKEQLVWSDGIGVLDGRILGFIDHENGLVTFGKFDAPKIDVIASKDFFMRNTTENPQPEIFTRYATEAFCIYYEKRVDFKIGDPVCYMEHEPENGFFRFAKNVLDLENRFNHMCEKRFFMAITSEAPLLTAFDWRDLADKVGEILSDWEGRPSEQTHSHIVQYDWKVQKVRIVQIGATIQNDEHEWATIGGFDSVKDAENFVSDFLSAVFVTLKDLPFDYWSWHHNRITHIKAD